VAQKQKQNWTLIEVGFFGGFLCRFFRWVRPKKPTGFFLGMYPGVWTLISTTATAAAAAAAAGAAAAAAAAILLLLLHVLPPPPQALPLLLLSYL